MDEMPRFQEDEEKKTRRPVLLIPIILIVLVLIGVAILLFFLLRPQPAGPEPAPATFTPIPPTETTEAPATFPPNAPSNILGDESPIYNVCLNWSDNSDNEDGFRVYRRRLDIIGAPEQSGEVGENITDFCDLSTFCGATYQYTVASFNEAGESPATVCWQIVMTPCPQVRVMRLGVGLDLARNFQTGQLGQTGDFYLDIGPDGTLMLMADQEGQLGLIDLGDLGGLPLTQVELPANPEWVRDGLPAIAGHVYVALQRDGQSMIIFSLSALGNPSKLEYFIYRPADVIVSQECQRVGGYVPGGTCVSGDGVCDPTCVAASTDQTGQPVPDDVLQQPDQFEEIYNEMLREADSGNILLVAWNFFTGTVASMIQPPPLQEYPTPTYTERDYDCTNQPCISYDGVCVPDCATDDGYREWDDDQTCQNGGPDYTVTLAAGQYIYPLCTPNGETPAPGYGSTADRTGRYVDVDCNPTPCVTGDGVCTPGCIPNPNDQGQPDITQVSYVDGDCGGPCNSNDGICTPLCDPYYNYNTNLTAAYGDQYQANYDRDCGTPCETQDQCGCTPVTTYAGNPYCGEHPGDGGDQRCNCGDGYCNPSCENADLCGQDCPCVDNGICEAGETPRCKDCSNEPGAQCGVPCPAGVCGAGLTCQSGICWATWCAPVQTEEPPQCQLINCKCVTAGMSLCYDSCTGAPTYVQDPNCP